MPERLLLTKSLRIEGKFGVANAGLVLMYSKGSFRAKLKAERVKEEKARLAEIALARSRSRTSEAVGMTFFAAVTNGIASKGTWVIALSARARHDRIFSDFIFL